MTIYLGNCKLQLIKNLPVIPKLELSGQEGTQVKYIRIYICYRCILFSLSIYRQFSENYKSNSAQNGIAIRIKHRKHKPVNLSQLNFSICNNVTDKANSLESKMKQSVSRFGPTDERSIH